ncbi:UPF0553 protein C9orf64 [Hypsibius exemplaris]|uniref:Queuosine 5'-phosphate N-glycosylase/hydrolase n=1 Tax=Hypsibius exemplaris TaxID=2072580 RepID=A0A9X6NDM3_HYPEX|nr:UPF0553 protein C9orf64 [Hypsibius exemplaris]
MSEDDDDGQERPTAMPMSPSEGVRQSAEWVLSVSQHVTVDRNAVSKLAHFLASEFSRGGVSAVNWKDHELRPKTSDNFAVDWIFLVNALNFSFWSGPVESQSTAAKFAVEFNGKQYTGSMSCWAAINRAVQEGIPIFDAAYLAGITEDQVRHLFRTSTSGEMPLLEDRRKNLQEAGQVLLEKFGGTFWNCCKLADGNAQQLLHIILENFPSFRDCSVYHGRKVEFYKRAQVVVADIWSCFENSGYGHFSDIDSLTIFADYRIPQVLNFFGATKYSDELQVKLKANEVFKYGDVEEVEIRASTIFVAELLVKEVNVILRGHAGQVATPSPPVNGILLDQYLWGYRQSHDSDMKHIPFHKVRSIYY